MAEHSGQPMKFKSVKELEDKIEAYFNSYYKVTKDDDGNKILTNYIPLTVSGLAIALDCDRRTLLNYSNKEEYFPTIRKAKARIENFAELSLWQPKIASGIMFNLKNNYPDWVDKREIVADVNANINKITVAPVVFED